MVLSDIEIKKIQELISLINPFNLRSLQGASYDLGLGRQYCRNSEILDLPERYHSLLIRPGEFVLLTSYETLKLPNYLVGHNGLMSCWTKRGLVSLFSPQIDPGFEGILIVPVYNAGQNDISIKIGAPMFTVEFLRCEEASRGWAEKNGAQTGIQSPWGPNLIGPNIDLIGRLKETLKEHELELSELRRELVQLKAKTEAHDKYDSKFISKRALFLSIVGTIVALITLSIKLEVINI